MPPKKGKIKHSSKKQSCLQTPTQQQSNVSSMFLYNHRLILKKYYTPSVSIFWSNIWTSFFLDQSDADALKLKQIQHFYTHKQALINYCDISQTKMIIRNVILNRINQDVYYPMNYDSGFYPILTKYSLLKKKYIKTQQKMERWISPNRQSYAQKSSKQKKRVKFQTNKKQGLDESIMQLKLLTKKINNMCYNFKEDSMIGFVSQLNKNVKNEDKKQQYIGYLEKDISAINIKTRKNFTHKRYFTSIGQGRQQPYGLQNIKRKIQPERTSRKKQRQHKQFKSKSTKRKSIEMPHSSTPSTPKPRHYYSPCTNFKQQKIQKHEKQKKIKSKTKQFKKK